MVDAMKGVEQQLKEEKNARFKGGLDEEEEGDEMVEIKMNDDTDDVK